MQPTPPASTRTTSLIYQSARRRSRPVPPRPVPGVADVYVDNRSRVWLLDINPFSGVTDSLLFDWSEDALTAPLPAPAPTPRQQDEEELPPGVFMRVHFDPVSPSPPPGGVDSAGPLAAAAAEAGAAVGENGSRSSMCSAGGASEGQRGEPGNVRKNVLAGATGFALAGREGRGFELRCVPSSLHMVPDPMGRYRGPADVGMGTLMCGTGGSGGLELEDLIETCRLAGNES